MSDNIPLTSFTVALLHTIWVLEILLTNPFKNDLTPARTVQTANYNYGIYILHPKHTVDQYKNKQSIYSISIYRYGGKGLAPSYAPQPERSIGAYNKS